MLRSRVSMFALAFVVSPVLGGVQSDKTNTATQAAIAAEAGRSSVAYSRALAKDGIRVYSGDLDWLSDYEDDCGRGLWSKLTGEEEPPTPEPEGEDKRRQLHDFLQLYCEPVGKWWMPFFERCDTAHDRVCEDSNSLYDLLDIDAYYQAVVEGLRSSKDPLERYNIIASLFLEIDEHAMHLPMQRASKWYVQGAKEYLGSANPDDVAKLIDVLLDLPRNRGSSVADLLVGYLKSARGVSAEKREEMLSLVKKEFKTPR